MKNLLVIFFAASLLSACEQAPREFDASLAWQEFEQTLETNYAYLNTQQVDKQALFSHYKKQANNITNEAEFIDLLQVVTRFFIDPHLNVGPMNEFDYSVMPTGSDIWAKLVDDHYVIEDIKRDSAAAKSNLKVGDKIITIDGKSIDGVILDVYANTTFPLSPQHKLWAVNIALGGLRSANREIEVEDEQNQKHLHSLDSTYAAIIALRQEKPVYVERLGDVAYIRVNNSLGNRQTVEDFKTQLSSLLDTKGLIIDLRNTPSGGNTGVAEPILGHFVTQKTTYQLYQSQQDGVLYSQAEMQSAATLPSSPHYAQPYVVLTGRWTGSMGEGMAIGFDAMGAKAIIGAPMADLLGGINTFSMSESGASIELGFDRMFHVNGTYREDFVPNNTHIPADTAKDGSDPALDEAIRLLSR